MASIRKDIFTKAGPKTFGRQFGTSELYTLGLYLGLS